MARSFQAAKVALQLLPAPSGFVTVDATIGLPVPIHNGRGGVIGKGPHLTARGRVVGGNAWEIIGPVNTHIEITCEGNGIVGRAGEHEVYRAGIVYLHNGRVLACTVGGDCVLFGAVITALANANRLVACLALIKATTVIRHHLAQLAGQPVPIFKALATLRLCGGGGEPKNR